jgi:hypothetical protein
MISRGSFETASIGFSIEAVFENRLYRAFMSIEAVLIKALLKFLEVVLSFSKPPLYADFFVVNTRHSFLIVWP